MSEGSPATGSTRFGYALDDVRVVAIACVAVVALIYHLPALFSPAWLIAPLLVCLWRAMPARLLLAAVCVMAAWTLIEARAQLAAQWPVAADGAIVDVTGRVTGLPENDGFRTRFILRTTKSGRRLRLSWYGDAPALLPGDCLALRVKLKTPHGSLNPGGFDYAAWLWQKNIDATGYVRSAGHCHAPPVWTLDRLRAAALARLAPVLAGSPVRGIIEALTLGVRQHITKAQWATLRATGTSHLVAISGLHIGLIAALLFALARWLALRWRPTQRLARMIACGIAFIGACLYAALAGWALPTQRALVMLGVALFAIASERAILPGRALAWAALVVVALDPAAVIASGFWLSFAAVAWLMWIATAARGPVWLRWVWIQLGLLFALMPVTLWFFGQASLIAPLVNAVLIPASAVIVPGVLLATLAALVAPHLGGLLLAWVAKALAFGWHGLALAAQVPGVAVSHVFASTLLLALAIVGLLWLAAPLPLRLRMLGALVALPVLLGYGPLDRAIAPGEMRLTVLDVGQGLATVVRTAHHTLVFDAGPANRSGFNSGSMIVVPYLRYVGRPRVDMMMISHGDMDHIGGAKAIVAGVNVRRRVGAGSATPCVAGMHWRWDGVFFRVLSPPSADRDIENARNNNSCVLHIVSRHGSVLETGDIEAIAEQAMVAAVAPRRLASQVLVVPHHGSATSSSPQLLAAVSPRVALDSSGWHNRWHFPSAAVVARYKARHIVFYNTATAGALAVRWDSNGGLHVTRERRRHDRFWLEPKVTP